MKRRLVVLFAFIACVAGALAFFALRGSTSAPAAPSTVVAPPTAVPTLTRVQIARLPLPRTWLRGLVGSNTGRPTLIACVDRNRDGRINGSDAPQYASLDISVPSSWMLCGYDATYADFYDGPPSNPAGYSCAAGHRPILIVAVGGAGTDLLNAPEGESLGLLDIVNQLEARAAAASFSSAPMLAASAIWGAADHAQTSMEQWLEAELTAKLDAMPCLRVALIGHSHGGATVTSVTHILDARYSSRMFGVIIDRSTVLYDRFALDYPARTPILNVYQRNEGWHGEYLPFPNVTNVDESAETAPIAPSDGGGPTAPVTHKTLDDSPGAQHLIVDSIMAWATR